MKMVHDRLEERGCPFYFLNHADIDETTVDIDFGSMTGVLASPSGECPVEELGSFYYRPYDLRHYPHIQPVSNDNAALLPYYMVEKSIWMMSELSGGLIVNPQEASASNQSKPVQAALIKKAGFEIPDTLITSVPKEVLAFEKKHGRIIYKSISAARSIVKVFGREDKERLDDIRHLPVQFQQFVEGTDYRVHIVGDRGFTAKIVSDSDDYRYGDATVESAELPEDVREKCFRLSRGLGLIVCGIDLRVDLAGQWYCLEVNPSPGFSYYEAHTGQPVSAAIAELLHTGLKDQ